MLKLKRSIKGVEPAVVIEAIGAIQAEHGLRPDTVLKASTPEDAPLHPAFTWDNGEAAHKYRLEEARNIIQAVHVVGDDGTDNGRAFVYVPSFVEDQASEFLPVAQVVGNRELFERACDEFKRNIAGNQVQLDQLIGQAELLNNPVVKKLRRASRSLSKAVGSLE